jgi:hypothetical protein
MDREIGLDNIFENLDEALQKAREVLGMTNGNGNGTTTAPPAA